VVVEEGRFESLEEMEEKAEASPFIHLVNLLIKNAIRDGVSDVHIEPDLGCLRVRYRIDGLLKEINQLPMAYHGAVVSRLKIMANLDIAERRVPQDGRIRINVDAASVDLRLSTMPTVLGEKVVLRILDKRRTVMDLDKLGFNAEILEGFKDALRKPSGLVLVTGPTGSGKTTTLYSAINMLNSMEKNLITIEDPVEYQFNFINQVQVSDKTGLSFAKVLRAVLRQDPDIVMVGEIRDRETAEIAIQASLTGHLVISTLHTNDAPGAVTRLIDMGVEPFLVASALSGVLAQRLLRKICPECKTMYYPGDEVLALLGVEGNKQFKIGRGRGCDACYDTGFKGRAGVHEFFAVGDEARKAIMREATLDELRALRERQGYFSLRQDALDKVRRGLTSMEEVTRVLYAEGDVDY
ncbi:MAG: GspE/PulE family protein, partial [Candidatus Methylomirabilis sp.]|nr:GspE/PulE family protein [Deltaproteobacteria bacterium]